MGDSIISPIIILTAQKFFTLLNINYPKALIVEIIYEMISFPSKIRWSLRTADFKIT